MESVLVVVKALTYLKEIDKERLHFVSFPILDFVIEMYAFCLSLSK